MFSSCSHDSVVPGSSADGLKRQIPNPPPIEDRLTPEYLKALWGEEWNQRSYVMVIGQANLMDDDDDVVAGTPNGYPSPGEDDYECSVMIPAGSVQQSPPTNLKIFIEVPEFESSPRRPHPAFFSIYTLLDYDLTFSSPVTVTICDFPWIPGNDIPVINEYTYYVNQDEAGNLSYSELQVVFPDYQTGAITFEIDVIPGHGFNFLDRPDRSGTWVNETDEEADD